MFAPFGVISQHPGYTTTYCFFIFTELTVHHQERLDQFKKEVPEFHNFLALLLPKLDNVKQVKYTHGSEERGADFILNKEDTTLGITSYAGVIAKVGKIHSDTTVIERQIDECQMGRYFDEGKKGIFLDEVWVVTNQSISTRAQDKIAHKFRATNVKFITGEVLIPLIDKHMPSFWTDVEIEVSEYLTVLESKTAKVDQGASLLGLVNADFYIEQQIYNVVPPQYERTKRYAKPQHPIDIYEVVEKFPLVLIEAPMGFGKSCNAPKKLDTRTVNVTEQEQQQHVAARARRLQTPRA